MHEATGWPSIDLPWPLAAESDGRWQQNRTMPACRVELAAHTCTTGEHRCELKRVSQFVPQSFAPRSWAEAQRLPWLREMAYDDCPGGSSPPTCCCAFWNVEPARQHVLNTPPACKAAFLWKRAARNDEAPASSTLDAHVGPAPCRFVVAISGNVSSQVAPRLACALRRVQRAFELNARNGTCGVGFFSVAAEHAKHVERELRNASWLVDYQLEIDDHATRERINRAEEGCAGHKDLTVASVRAVFSKRTWARSHSATKPRRLFGIASLRDMHRKVWLAHLMARKLAAAELIVRARVDGHWDSPSGRAFQWHQALRDLRAPAGMSPGLNVHVRASGWKYDLSLWGAVACAVNDQFAVGTPEAMDGYSSLYPDWGDSVRTLLLHRRVDGSNEYPLRWHLHYRGVRPGSFLSFPFGFVLNKSVLHRGCDEDEE